MMLPALSRRSFVASMMAGAAPAGKSRRLCYNYDAWSPFYEGLSAPAIHANVDMFAGTQVTTLMLSPNIGQALSYPSQVGEMCHSRESAAPVLEQVRSGMGEMVAQAGMGLARAWREKRVDGFGLLVEHCLARGLETFASFRMNDLHMVTLDGGRGPYTDEFYRRHPEWRVTARRGLNYAIPEVRRYRLAVLEELLRRYPLAGLDLDFHRTAPFFPAGTAEASAPLMTEFIVQVREMTRRVAKETNRRILLSARVPSSLVGCRRAGLDPIAWHRQGCLDFLSVAHFLHLFFDLPIEQFQRELPGLPIFASLDFIVGGSMDRGVFYAREANAEMYRGAAAAAYAKGAHSIYLFNMFAARANGPDPSGKDWSHREPVEVLKELGDPRTLRKRSKLYLVDTRIETFDQPALDTPAQLPRQTPFSATLISGEDHGARGNFKLRIEAVKLPSEAKLHVEWNGRDIGTGVLAREVYLFPEPYTQTARDPRNCLDFAVPAAAVTRGVNRLSLAGTAGVVIKNIELAFQPS